jgi:dCTP deaminase
MIELNYLHKNELGHLPRPSEPNELKRFNRIINKQIEKFNEAIKKSPLNNKNFHKEISIYTTEDFGEETFNGDPLMEFKKDRINNKLLSKGKFDTQKIDINSSENESYHIKIPRIDAYNACKWPTLLHELGHHLLKKEFFGNNTIENHFVSFINNEENDFINDSKNIINLNNWLLECWCDLFAASTMGPAFWYSQYSSFIFNGVYELVSDDTGKYPYPFPAFRLKLIKRVLTHRLQNSLVDCGVSSMLTCEMLVSKLDTNFKNNQRWMRLFQLFEKYFLQNFFTKDNTKIFLGSEHFNEQIEPLLKYTKKIDKNVINSLLDDLKVNLPIPTKREKEEEIFERFNSVQDILLSAWIFRNSALKEDVFKKLDFLKYESLQRIFEDKIIKAFSFFDNNILKSIQVTEWVTLFEENVNIAKSNEFINEIKEYIVARNKEKDKTEGKIINYQYVDFEIYNKLLSKELRIIPLINPTQIGTTSLDIRLGTSFQFYFHNQVGILDYTNKNSLENTEQNTKTIDLDFLESITIAPQQFMLGHSMEYILLPDDLSAELDGRSSFARSGLQIHMTAGFVEPGFAGVLTFEFYNAGPNPIRLFPGMRIGQLRFLPVQVPAIPYSKKRDAKYKGLLSHYKGLQSKDEEVQILFKAIKENKY